MVFVCTDRAQEKISDLVNAVILGKDISEERSYRNMINQIKTEDIRAFASWNEIPKEVYFWIYKKADAIKAIAEYATRRNNEN